MVRGSTNQIPTGRESLRCEVNGSKGVRLLRYEDYYGDDSLMSKPGELFFDVSTVKGF